MCRFLTLWVVHVSPTLCLKANCSYPPWWQWPLHWCKWFFFVCLSISAMFLWCMHIHVWHQEPQEPRMCNIHQVLPFQLWVSQGQWSGSIYLFVWAPISPVPVVLPARINLCVFSQCGATQGEWGQQGTANNSPVPLVSLSGNMMNVPYHLEPPGLGLFETKSLSGACRHLFIVQSQGDLLWLLFCYVLFLFKKDLSEKFYT